jgi:hypothetical protein
VSVVHVNVAGLRLCCTCTDRAQVPEIFSLVESQRGTRPRSSALASEQEQSEDDIYAKGTYSRSTLLQTKLPNRTGLQCIKEKFIGVLLGFEDLGKRAGDCDSRVVGRLYETLDVGPSMLNVHRIAGKERVTHHPSNTPTSSPRVTAYQRFAGRQIEPHSWHK